MLSDISLRRWFREYNERWWGGALPADVDILWAPIQSCAADCDGLANDPESLIIRLHPMYALDVKQSKITLLHEMVHVELFPYRGHGPRFKARIRELMAAGAYDNLL